VLVVFVPVLLLVLVDVVVAGDVAATVVLDVDTGTVVVAAVLVDTVVVVVAVVVAGSDGVDGVVACEVTGVVATVSLAPREDVSVDSSELPPPQAASIAAIKVSENGSEKRVNMVIAL
jgi:hypothetical protein